MTVDVTAEMVASVVRVAVQPGEQVAAGDTLLVVESMKMEIPVRSPVAGRVADLCVAAADVIQEGDLLARIKPVEQHQRAD